MSSKFPTDINLSLQEFALHGGGSGPHEDGWGVAYAMGRDFRIVKEAEAAFDSDCVAYIQDHAFQSRFVISHIRRASPPKQLEFENTHPFDRELFGRRFIFAHNGFVKAPEALPGFGNGRFMPMGGTDSEKVFCYLLEAIQAHIRSPERYHPRLVEEALLELSPKIRALGKFNYLLSDTEYLFAHGDSSLYSVCRSCHLEETALESDVLKVLLAHGPDQEVSLVATVPLTDSEHWSRFEPGEIRVFHHGRQV
jgi:glutamine amidotransferase